MAAELLLRLTLIDTNNLESSLSIFRPGSTTPSAILYTAWESFAQRLPKADESIRTIRPDLAAAVDECIDAAGQEWEPYWQRRLLNICFLIRFTRRNWRSILFLLGC